MSTSRFIMTILGAVCVIMAMCAGMRKKWDELILRDDCTMTMNT